MVNANQDEKQSEETKLSPLGIEEINSVIKSFKNSTFNQEKLYQKDEKNFVKKSLFDLAKESEIKSSEKNQSETDKPEEKEEIEKKTEENKEIFEEPNEKKDTENTNVSDDLNQNNDNKENKIDQTLGYIDETIKPDEVSKEKIDDEHDKVDEFSKENIDQDVKDINGQVLEANLTETNKTEYEEKTLEALDSVREAVTKSLEENNESQNKEIEDNNNSKIVSSDIISEINLINTLFKNIREITNDEIENIVKSKVIELAEGVIGYQIEKFPDKFVNKIKNSINDIKSINNDVKIYLNDQDFQFLNKFIEKNKTEINFKLASEPSLGRGDFTIDMGGVVQAIKYKKIID